jgi:hypothetical protein
MSLVSLLKYLSQLLILAVGFAAIWWDRRVASQDSSKRKPTVMTFIAAASMAAGFILFIAADIKSREDDAKRASAQAEQISNLKQVVAGQKDELELAKHIKSVQEELTEQAKELNAQQAQQLSSSEALKRDQQEQLAISGGLANAQRRQIGLSTVLTAQQKQQLRRLKEMRLDRELSGVEVSFTPSLDQWARITFACGKIPPASLGFPYSASTITAERVGDHWEIEFGEIRDEDGNTILPPPLSTQSPEGKAFEEVINLAMVELRIEWGSSDLGPDEVTMLSVGRTYPASVRISKDTIAFTFRPPKLRLYLSHLYDNPVVRLRGQQYPTSIRFRSLDDKVKFDERSALNWVMRSGDPEVEKWLPYVSEPLHLDIDWSRLLH